MKAIKEFKKVPDNSIILNEFDRIDYCDSYRIMLKTDESVDKVATDFFIATDPKWIKTLVKIRDFCVKIFKLRTSDKNAHLNSSSYYTIGSKLGEFSVIDRNENEIVLGEKDKHLNFKVSILLNKSELYTIMFVTTIVHYNNMLGRLYFIPVRPFHKLIVKSMLKTVNNKQN